jgi:hypothetical protein
MLMPLDEIRHFVNFKTNVRLPMKVAFFIKALL